MRGSQRLRTVLVLIVLTAVTLTFLDFSHASTGPLGALRRGVDTVLGPVVRAVGGAASSVGGALGGLPRLGSYQSDNAALRRENARLKGALAASSGLQCQADQLNALLHTTGFLSLTTVPAHVVSLGSSFGFEWTATIDAGAKDGLRPGQTVVSGAGLVGRTTDVGPFTSTVLLLADPGFAVGSKLAASASFGLLRGNGLSPMRYQVVGQKPPVHAGDVLVTTGSGTFAPGIPVGTVTSIAPDSDALTRTATVTPFVDVTSLDLVAVVTAAPRSAPRQPLLPVRPGAVRSPAPCAPSVPAGPVPSSRPSPAAPRRPVAAPSPSVSPTP